MLTKAKTAKEMSRSMDFNFNKRDNIRTDDIIKDKAISRQLSLTTQETQNDSEEEISSLPIKRANTAQDKSKDMVSRSLTLPSKKDRGMTDENEEEEEGYQEFLQIKVALAEMKKGQRMTRWEVQYGTVSSFFLLNDEQTTLSWNTPKFECLFISNIEQILPGDLQAVKTSPFFTIKTKDRTMHIFPGNWKSFDVWYRGLLFLIGKSVPSHLNRLIQFNIKNLPQEPDFENIPTTFLLNYTKEDKKSAQQKTMTEKFKNIVKEFEEDSEELSAKENKSLRKEMSKYKHERSESTSSNSSLGKITKKENNNRCLLYQERVHDLEMTVDKQNELINLLITENRTLVRKQKEQQTLIAELYSEIETMRENNVDIETVEGDNRKLAMLVRMEEQIITELINTFIDINKNDEKEWETNLNREDEEEDDEEREDEIE